MLLVVAVHVGDPFGFEAHYLRGERLTGRLNFPGQAGVDLFFARQTTAAPPWARHRRETPLTTLASNRRSTSRPISRLVAAYALAAVSLALLGVRLAMIDQGSLASLTAVAALAGTVVLFVRGIRTRTLSSPLTLMGIPLLLSLATAMSPTTKLFTDWAPDTLIVVVLIVLAPLIGVVLAILATDGRIPTLDGGTAALPHAARLVAVCCLLTLVGTLVLLSEFAHAGGPPLLSANIDQARFRPVGGGLLQLLTDGLPLALLIATWARVARPGSFSAGQRRVLVVIIVWAPVMTSLGGGRITVALPLLTAFVVAGRYLRPSASRRLLVLLPLGILAFSSAVFLARHRQHPSQASSRAVLYSPSGQGRSPVLASAYAAFNITLGEQLRVVEELRNAHVTTPPFTSSVYLFHRFLPQATNAGTVASPYTGGWQASGYAGPLLLDFGLLGALPVGVALGGAAHLLYRRFAAGRSVGVIWVYAYLAGPLAVAFYDNIFLNYFYPIVDVVVLIFLSKALVIAPRAEGAEGRDRPNHAATRVRVQRGPGHVEGLS